MYQFIYVQGTLTLLILLSAHVQYFMSSANFISDEIISTSSKVMTDNFQLQSKINEYKISWCIYLERIYQDHLSKSS